MTSTKDFNFDGTILRKYTGPGGEVVIPDGVTAISDLAFWESGVTHVTIPASVREIGDNAFVVCKSLKTVTICGSVDIGNGAFTDCRNLTSVTVGGDLLSAGRCAFDGCKKLETFSVEGKFGEIESNAFDKCEKLADSKGFLILGGNLVTYLGTDDHVIVPDTVQHLISCSGNTIVSLELPDSVTKAEEYGLSGSKLKLVSIPSALLNQWQESHATVYRFFLWGGLVLEVRDGEQVTYYAYAGVKPTDYRTFNCKDSITQFIQTGMWGLYDNDLKFNNVEFKYKPAVRLMGMLGRLLKPVELSGEHQEFFTKELVKGAKKILDFAEEVCRPDIISRYLSLNLLDEKKKKAFMDQVAQSVVPEIAALAGGGSKEEPASEAPAVEAGPAPALSPDEIARIYAKKWADCKGITLLKNMKLVGVSMPDTKLTDGSPAPVDLFRFILVSYGKQHPKGPYGINKEADEAAALLSYDSLCDAMDRVSDNLNGPAYPAILPMLCRFGSPKQIKALTASHKAWGEWGNYGSKGRTAQKALEQALVLSDTRAAVVFLEKLDKLEPYAKMRGLTVDEVYETHLFDFGFDAAGLRTFDLGVTQIDATLTPSLTLELVNRATGKSVRSIPKAKIDPVVQKKAANELDDMRQNLKKAVFLKQRQLWNDYLEGTLFPVDSWKKSYLSNYFLNRIARILVWQQAGKTFLLTDSGAVDSAGNAVTLTADDVRVAHPMEMDREDVAAWQRYFTSHGLKQPFGQIWEPVLPESDFRPDRYKSCSIPNLFFRGQDKRGIQIVWSYADYYENFDLTIDGFDVTFDPDPQDPDRVEITNLQPVHWNRRTNMIVAWLDKLTVYDRVKKDDPSVMDQMDAFTLAQVTEFIETAQKAGATNVTALLLEYKNTHFGGFDPMDEFTLDF